MNKTKNFLAMYGDSDHITKLIKNPQEMPREVIDNPSLGKEHFPYLLHSHHRWALLRHPEMHQQELNDIVAGNKILKKEYGNDHVDRDYKAVLRNPKLAPEHLDYAAKHGTTDEKEMVSNNPNSPIEALNRLSGHTSRAVRRGVASNPNTPVETLKKLVDDPEVFDWALEHPKCDESMQRYMLNKHPKLERLLVCNHNAKSGILKDYVDHPIHGHYAKDTLKERGE